MVSVSVVYRVSTRKTVDELARSVRADVGRHGTVTLLGARSQARQLRRVQGALRASGHTVHYFTDGDLHMLTVSFGPGERTVGWWGGLTR